VFFCGTPIAAVGPVAETRRPIFTCAVAGSAACSEATMSEARRITGCSGADDERRF
jgi:hypothetical protein